MKHKKDNTKLLSLLYISIILLGFAGQFLFRSPAFSAVVGIVSVPAVYLLARKQLEM